jgi:multicomponent Na+:H+ antiporter subunit C
VVPGEAVSDPLPQALALTALVIGLATVALLLALVHQAIVVFRTAEQDELAATETRHEAGLEPERQADREEVAADPDSERQDESERAR